jgi:glutaredoxin 3
MKQVIKKIDIYTSNLCPYCHRAKELLRAKGLTFNELRINGNAELSAEVVERSGGMRTVPQIFIENHHVGGYDELNMLDQKGQLNSLLDLD